jgi:hypothetical protein
MVLACDEFLTATDARSVRVSMTITYASTTAAQHAGLFWGGMPKQRLLD